LSQGLQESEQTVVPKTRKRDSSTPWRPVPQERDEKKRLAAIPVGMKI
jgi:hypothetical protein